MNTKVKQYNSRIEAEIGKGLLEANGIPSVISSDDTGGWHHDLMMSTGGVSLLVNEEDKEKALELLE